MPDASINAGFREPVQAWLQQISGATLGHVSKVCIERKEEFP